MILAKEYLLILRRSVDQPDEWEGKKTAQSAQDDQKSEVAVVGFCDTESVGEPRTQLRAQTARGVVDGHDRGEELVQE